MLSMKPGSGSSIEIEGIKIRLARGNFIEVSDTKSRQLREIHVLTRVTRGSSLTL